MAKHQGDGGVAAEGWYPDPQGRYEQRYFDGAAWTQHVATAGTVTNDGGAVGEVTGAMLYGTRATFSPSAPTRSAGGSWSTPPRYANRVGPGLAIYLAGLFLLVVSLTLPWLDGRGPFDIEVADQTSTAAGLGGQLGGSMVWAVIWLFLTCLPFQPGKLLGFLGAGCIGLVVFWAPLADDSPSKRSNGMGVFVLIVHLIVLWITFAAVRSDYAIADAPMGIGPFVLTAAYLVMMVGAAIGRRRVRVS